LMPEGFVFAPHPAVTETDRDKYCVRRIVDFYKRHRVNYADYFLAAWTYRHCDDLGKPNATLRDVAADAGLSARYLATVWATLGEEWPEHSPLGELQKLWRNLPDDPRARDAAREGCERMRDLVDRLRKGFEPRVEAIKVRRISPGSQPFVLWKDRALADRRMQAPAANAPRNLTHVCRCV